MSVGLAMKLAGGLVQVAVVGGEETLYSSRLACPDCGINVPQLEPRSFSFNSAYGACPECHGLGSKYDFDPAKIITDWSKPLLDGGLGPGLGIAESVNTCCSSSRQPTASNLARRLRNCRRRFRTCLLYGEAERRRQNRLSRAFSATSRRILKRPQFRQLSRLHAGLHVGNECSACRGKRLRPESLAVKVNGMSIADFTSPAGIAIVRSRAKRSSSTGREELIAGRIMHEIVERLQFLHAVGLGYISLDRSAATLSGGEGQRIRLATQIGSKLRGVLYVLDEPSIGLHHRDNHRLLLALEELRDLGNTVLVVEHDEETIRRADYVIDLGPGAGRHGGALVRMARRTKS